MTDTGLGNVLSRLWYQNGHCNALPLSVTPWWMMVRVVLSHAIPAIYICKPPKMRLVYCSIWRVYFVGCRFGMVAKLRLRRILIATLTIRLPVQTWLTANLLKLAHHGAIVIPSPKLPGLTLPMRMRQSMSWCAVRKRLPSLVLIF